MQKLLLAVDGSKSCSKAVGKVYELAEDMDLDVTVLTVLEKAIPKTYSEEFAREAFSRREGMKEKAKDMVDTCSEGLEEKVSKLKKEVKTGVPSDVICRTAEEGDYDFVVVADKGRGAVKRFLMGSTAERVTRYSPISVIVVK